MTDHTDIVERLSAEFERGRQQGMQQERALWELAKSTQEIETQTDPSAQAVPLTDDSIDNIWAGCSDNDDRVNIHKLARAVERAVFEANGIATKAA
jgi:hypothetical protein